MYKKLLMVAIWSLSLMANGQTSVKFQDLDETTQEYSQELNRLKEEYHSQLKALKRRYNDNLKAIQNDPHIIALQEQLKRIEVAINGMGTYKFEKKNPKIKILEEGKITIQNKIASIEKENELLYSNINEDYADNVRNLKTKTKDAVNKLNKRFGVYSSDSN